MSMINAEASEFHPSQKALDQELSEDGVRKIDEFLHRFTLLSCECGVFVARDVNDKPVVVFMEPEDYADSYALNSDDELIRA